MANRDLHRLNLGWRSITELARVPYEILWYRRIHWSKQAIDRLVTLNVLRYQKRSWGFQDNMSCRKTKRPTVRSRVIHVSPVSSIAWAKCPAITVNHRGEYRRATFMVHRVGTEIHSCSRIIPRDIKLFINCWTILLILSIKKIQFLFTNVDLSRTLVLRIKQRTIVLTINEANGG